MLICRNSILIKISLLILIRLIFCFQLTQLNAQNKRVIEIRNAESLEYDEKVNLTARRLIGNVILAHNNIIMHCDSAWLYNDKNAADAFGNVHIEKDDSLNMYADFVNYDGTANLVKARNNVTLKDNRITITTDSLDFDNNTNIGYYNTGGKIVDSTNVLTSTIGRFYSNENVLFFKDSVKVFNKDYTTYSDTLKYNTKTETVHIVGPTHIISENSELYSELGWFDTKTKNAELLKNSTIWRDSTILEADTIVYNDLTSNGIARSNVIINDLKNKIIIAGHKTNYDDFSKQAMVSDSAVFIQYTDKDTLYLHADTLFSESDSSAIDQKIVKAYYGVRFFKLDMQGRCDSLTYFSKDSTIKLFNDPVLWSMENQMTSDSIELINKSNESSIVLLHRNSFVIQEVDSIHLNQIKGKNMVGLISNRRLTQIDVNGNGQSIYYPVDQTIPIGLNRAESSNIRIMLDKNKIQRITFITSPDGTLKPLLKLEQSELKLDGFNYRKSERPIDKYGIFCTEIADCPKNFVRVQIKNRQYESKKEIDSVEKSKD